MSQCFSWFMTCCGRNNNDLFVVVKALKEELKEERKELRRIRPQLHRVRSKIVKKLKFKEYLDDKHYDQKVIALRTGLLGYIPLLFRVVTADKRLDEVNLNISFLSDIKDRLKVRESRSVTRISEIQHTLMNIAAAMHHQAVQSGPHVANLRDFDDIELVNKLPPTRNLADTQISHHHGENVVEQLCAAMYGRVIEKTTDVVPPKGAEMDSNTANDTDIVQQAVDGAEVADQPVDGIKEADKSALADTESGDQPVDGTKEADKSALADTGAGDQPVDGAKEADESALADTGAGDQPVDGTKEADESALADTGAVDKDADRTEEAEESLADAETGEKPADGTEEAEESLADAETGEKPADGTEVADESIADTEAGNRAIVGGS